MRLLLMGGPRVTKNGLPPFWTLEVGVSLRVKFWLRGISQISDGRVPHAVWGRGRGGSIENLHVLSLKSLLVRALSASK